MLRGWMVTLAMVAATAEVGVAQLDTSRIHPITAPIRDAGTLDLPTGTWSPSAGADYVGKIFDNTCQWTGGGFYFGSEHCEDVYDDGRIPSPTDPAAPGGATTDNQVDSFQIAYCTAHPTGQVGFDIGFFDMMAPCAGWLAQQALHVGPSYNGATAYYNLAGLNLPGGGGTLACWTVTIALGNGFCLMSDGDGSWSGIGDEFAYAFSHQMDNAIYGIASGMIISGEPLVGAFGSCSYGITCGTDATGNACGTGLGIADQMWENTDGTPVGGPVNTLLCLNGANTGCYWFGGWPANQWASFWMEMTSSGSCSGGDCDPPTFYCRYQDPSTGTPCGGAQCPSYDGCLATMFTSLIASLPVTDQNDYDVGFVQSANDKPAIIFGGFGQASIPFSGGTLCIKPPLRRTAPQFTGSEAGGACSGSIILRINDPSSTSTILNQPVGTVVQYQGWMRDPMGMSGTAVTDAVQVTFRAAEDNLGACPGANHWSVTTSSPNATIVPSAENLANYQVQCVGPDPVVVYRNGVRIRKLNALQSVRLTTSGGDTITVSLYSGTGAGGYWRKE